MSTGEIIGVVFGGIGAITGIIVFVRNVFSEKRKVIVKIGYAFGVGNLSGSEMINVQATNKKHNKINIQEVGFYRSDRKNVIDPYTNHPLGWIDGGDSRSFYFNKQTIQDMVEMAKEHGVKIIGAYVRDSTDVYYKRKIKKGSAWF
jgi:hypothetical protein